jgi:hypothetical protein
MAMTMTAGQIPLSRALSEHASTTARGEIPPTRGDQVLTPTAVIRTIVPSIVGFLLAFLASHNIHVSADVQEYLTGLLTVALGGAYYVVASALQSRWPLAGLLLGSTARPTYTGRHRKPSAIDPTTATSDSTPEDRP